MELENLLAPVAGESGIDDALKSWRWLVVNEVRPLLATAFGDLFVVVDSKAVWFLDIVAGKFEPTADSVEAWEAQLQDPDFIDRYFSPALISQLREAGAILAQGECYIPKHEPILGGSWSVENWSPGKWVFHLERQGRVHSAIKDLPEGTIITNWNYTEL